MKTSIIYTIKPDIKIFFLLLLLLANLSSSVFSLRHAVFAALIIIMVISTRISTRFLKSAMHILPFIITIALAVLLQSHNGGTIAADLGFVVIYKSGIDKSLMLIYKAVSSLLVFQLIIRTSDRNSLLHCIRKLRIPPLFIDMCIMSWNYISVLWQEYLHIKRAADSRGLVLRRSSATTALGAIVSGLFEKSLLRSESVHNAMISRGYSITTPMTAPQNRARPIKITDLLFAKAMILVITIGLFL